MTTPSLGLPEIAASQAQKHVTHNEALRILDALVQLTVLDRDLAAPPMSPADGARYIVAAGASGAWAGHEGKIAYRLDGAWSFYTPKPGWLAFIADETKLVYWSGSAWLDYSAAITALQSLALLGIGTTADAANPFAAKLNKVLWTAKTVAEGGDGDLRYTMNKETAPDVLSLLLQTGWSGRAELGLIGGDDFCLKVSADGSAWTTALAVDRMTGLATVGSLTVAGSFDVSAGGTTTLNNPVSVTSSFNVTRDASATLQRLICYRDTNGTHSSISADVARGTLAVPAFMTNTGLCLEVGTRPWDGSGFNTTTGRFAFRAAENHSASARGTRATIELAANGATATTEALAIEHGIGLSLFSSVAIDGNRHIRLRTYTIATLPAASPAGQMIYCSDLGGGGGQLNSDGTAWRRVSRGGQQTVSGDADFTLTVLTSAEDQRHSGTLTANRVVTLSTANAYAGARFRLTRTGGGAFTLSFGALKNLATNTWAEAIHDGSAWYLTAYGAL